MNEILNRDRSFNIIHLSIRRGTKNVYEFLILLDSQKTTFDLIILT